MYDREIEMSFLRGAERLIKAAESRRVGRQLLYVDGVLVAAISDKKAIDYLDERVDVHTG